ncbi:MAG TPA: hypothetical protein VN823_23595 [Stellaceae bacterium]|nr:hypothetical protein [Stellaceae bacterium]
MNDPKVRRIAIACDAACDIRVAVGEAAALAERWKASLHGVFFEDENLHRLAALPFGRQMTLSSAVSESFSSAELEKLSSALSASMRRELSEVAAQRGLEWSFGVVRDLPSATALAEIEADILVVDAAPRPFSGSWRPHSSLGALSEGHARTTLIRRQKPTKPGTVLILLGEQADRENALASGLLMAGSEDEILVLVRGGSPEDISSLKELAARLGFPGKIRFEVTTRDNSSLVRQIEGLKPVLLVLDGREVADPARRDLLANTQCDVLLVR